MITQQAVTHIPLSQYAFANSERSLTIRLRCAAGELERCILWYGDRVQPGDPIRFTPLAMEQTAHELDFDYYEEMGRYGDLDRESYLVIAKLTAILRLANGLDRSHKQKFKDVRITLKEGRLVITVDTNEDITLEKGLFDARAAFFLEVYNVRPVIRQRRVIGG